MKTWQSRHPNESAPDPEIELDRPMINLHSHHIFHDDRPDDKAEKGSWSDWRNNQQPEKIPGVG